MIGRKDRIIDGCVYCICVLYVLCVCLCACVCGDMICADGVCVDVPVFGDAIAEKQEVRTPETPLQTHHHCIQKSEV